MIVTGTNYLDISRQTSADVKHIKIPSSVWHIFMKRIYSYFHRCARHLLLIKNIEAHLSYKSHSGWKGKQHYFLISTSFLRPLSSASDTAKIWEVPNLPPLEKPANISRETCTKRLEFMNGNRNKTRFTITKLHCFSFKYEQCRNISFESKKVLSGDNSSSAGFITSSWLVDPQQEQNTSELNIKKLLDVVLSSVRKGRWVEAKGAEALDVAVRGPPKASIPRT